MSFQLCLISFCHMCHLTLVKKNVTHLTINEIDYTDNDMNLSKNDNILNR